MRIKRKIFGACLIALLMLAVAGCGEALQESQEGASETADATTPADTDHTPELIVDEPLQGAVSPADAPASMPLDLGAEETIESLDQDAAADAEGVALSEHENQDLDAPVARVGDETITGREFQREMHLVWQRMEMDAGGHVEPPEGFRLDVLNALIDARVMRILAKNEGFEVDEEDVVQEFETRKRLFNSEEEYQQYLRAVDLSEADLRENIRQRLLVDQYRESLVADVTMDEARLYAEYEQMAATGQLQRHEPTLDVAHILIRVSDPEDEAAWGAARARVEAARERIEAGEAFADVAREVSEDYLSAERGGLYPESTRGRVPAVIDEIMFDLEPGELSEPLRGQVGWHLVQVVKRNEPGRMSFDDVQEFIEEYLRESMISERMEAEIEQAKMVMHIDLHEAQANEVPLEHQH